jgi:TPR repeat protein
VPIPNVPVKILRRCMSRLVVRSGDSHKALMSKAKSPAKVVPVEHDYDSTEGVRAAVLAAKAGDELAAETLARRLSWILAGEISFSESELDELIGVAESGWNSILSDAQCHPDDMFQYAVDILWDDEGALIADNASDASGWMLRAAEGDHPDAQLEVGRLYLDGVGLKQSTPLAIEWFKKAAKDKDNAEHAEFFLSEIKKKSGKAPAKTPATKKAAAKKPAAKVVKKAASAKKAPAKAVKAPAKKPAAKPAAKKAAVKKPVATKTKVVAKPVKAVAKKIAKSAVKKAATKVVAKAVKPAAKKKAPAKRK